LMMAALHFLDPKRLTNVCEEETQSGKAFVRG
jgi:hypothetical protein